MLNRKAEPVAWLFGAAKDILTKLVEKLIKGFSEQSYQSHCGLFQKQGSRI